MVDVFIVRFLGWALLLMVNRYIFRRWRLFWDFIASVRALCLVMVLL